MLRGKVVDIDPYNKEVIMFNDDKISFDSLIIATGVIYNYYGHDKWLGESPH